jgi:ATP-binding cassette subfamily B multidrug efflux pump
VALLPFPLMGLAFWRISSHIHEASKDSLECFGKLNDHVQETLTGVRTLRALGLEQRSAARLSELAENAASASLRAQRWEAAFEPGGGHRAGGGHGAHPGAGWCAGVAGDADDWRVDGIQHVPGAVDLADVCRWLGVVLD